MPRPKKNSFHRKGGQWPQTLSIHEGPRSVTKNLCTTEITQQHGGHGGNIRPRQVSPRHCEEARPGRDDVAISCLFSPQRRKGRGGKQQRRAGNHRAHRETLKKHHVKTRLPASLRGALSSVEGRRGNLRFSTQHFLVPLRVSSWITAFNVRLCTMTVNFEPFLSPQRRRGRGGKQQSRQLERGQVLHYYIGPCRVFSQGQTE